MAKQPKEFGKIINTPEALAIYTEMQECKREIDILETREREHINTYYQMEGKYAMGMIAVAPEQGCRNYEYKYESLELKNKEREEMEKYRKENIAPLRNKILELVHKEHALYQNLCVALWGFSIEQYQAMQNLKRAEKELVKAQERVDYYKKQLEEIKERG